MLTKLKNTLNVTKICTIHYFEYSKDYTFGGESHDFWELVYVDKGEITAVAEDRKYILQRGDVIFHKPNEWHTLYANGSLAPNLVIVTFDCRSPEMNFFENKILKAGEREKKIISEIINEYLKAFETPLDDTFTKGLIRKKAPEFGSEQMIKLYVEQLLISMVRGNDITQQSLVKSNSVNASVQLMLGYMNNNMGKVINLDMIAKYVGLSKSSVSKMFKRVMGCGVMKYFAIMKIEAAKGYIREQNYNFTQIAELLGYNEIHYFSRQFKSVTGMSPTEYAKSVKALVKK